MTETEFEGGMRVQYGRLILPQSTNYGGFNFEQYQQQAETTAQYRQGPGHTFQDLAYTALGFAGEAGECANHIKKMHRDDHSMRKPERVAKVLDEIGDGLWYAAQLCTELGVSMQTVAEMNLEKLRSRAERNVIHGDGPRR